MANKAQLRLSDDDSKYLEEKLPELAVFAKLNTNYATVSRTEIAEAELAAIFYKEDGSRWRQNAINNRIAQKRIGIRSRTNQILMGVPVNEAGTTPPNNPMWKESQKGDEVGELYSARRSVARIAQELWTNRSDLKGKCDDPRFIDIDPEMLTDSVLKALDLDEFVPPIGGPKITKEQRLERYAQAIPHIRAMLGNLEPISIFDSGMQTETTKKYQRFTANIDERTGGYDVRLHNYRMFVISKGKNAGKLFIVHQKAKRGEHTFQVADLPSATRRLTHIDAQDKNKKAAANERDSRPTQNLARLCTKQKLE